MTVYSYSIKDNFDIFEREIETRMKHFHNNSATDNRNNMMFGQWDFEGFDFLKYSETKLRYLDRLQKENFWQGSKFQCCNFDNCRIGGYADTFTSKMSISIAFHKSSFSNSTFRNAVIDSFQEDCTFDNCIMTNARMAHISFHRCSFYTSDLENANFSFSNLHQCDFSYANMHSAKLEYTDFKRCEFAGARNILEFNFDERGYKTYIVNYGDILMIKSGCRWYTTEKAIDHWSHYAYVNKRGLRYLDAIKFAKDVFAERN